MKTSSVSYLAAAWAALVLSGCATTKISSKQVESLPTSKSVGELQVTLEAFETGLARSQTELGTNELEGDFFTRAAFSFKDAGRPSDDWDLAGYKLVAPNGEVRPHDSSRMSWPTNGMNLYLPGILSPQEPGWKLKVWFHRDDNFPEQELWTIKNLPVPGPNEWLEHPEQARFHGRQIQFTAISGAQVGSTNGFPAKLNHPNAHLIAPGKVRVLPVKAIAHFGGGKADETIKHFWIVSSNEGVLKPVPANYEEPVLPKEWHYGIGIDMPDGAKTIDLTLAITPVRKVEFIATPRLIQNTQRSARDEEKMK